MTTQTELLEAELELGRHAQLVGELELLVAAHPYQERLRGLLMLALYRSGRQAEALAAYQDARRVLSEELGLEPGEALRDLETAILRQDESLSSGAGRDAPRPTTPSPRRARRRWESCVPSPRCSPMSSALGPSPSGCRPTSSESSSAGA